MQGYRLIRPSDLRILEELGILQGDAYSHGKAFVKVSAMFHWVVDCYCSCPTIPLVGGTSQINVNKSISMTIYATTL